jgi:bifunctional non-homologous end joining protein LigD
VNGDAAAPPDAGPTGLAPLGSGYSYEVKWDGFRAIVSTEDGLRVRSRRGWDMTTLLPELAKLPSGLVLDGDLMAPDEDGRPSFPRLSPRILHGRPGIHVTLVVFDVLRVEGMSTMENSYQERRRLLEELDLQGAHWCTSPVFDDGAALRFLRLGIGYIVSRLRKEPRWPIRSTQEATSTGPLSGIVITWGPVGRYCATSEGAGVLFDSPGGQVAQTGTCGPQPKPAHFLLLCSP